ncbi:hypothetical protein BHE74_00036386 [Ensete ventricosum]|nr:hypothetical protein GW17_00008363 [Ensete ventricosum]RWW56855.1 hypothetical protein BHE74_00036386 [Ensete ventricosum]RZS18924.1 hypothetical protein BHM03_00051267 [Ensete ventricosum]
MFICVGFNTTRGSMLMAVAGEESHQVKIWDLNSGQWLMCLPQISDARSTEPPIKRRGMHCFFLYKFYLYVKARFAVLVQAVRIDPSVDRYADRPLPGGSLT